MATRSEGFHLIDSEAHSLLVRLDHIRPFVMHETMVLSAALPPKAQWQIEKFLHVGRNDLRRRLTAFITWLHSEGLTAPPAEQQKRFVTLRLQFNVVLSQFDLFTEVVTQRSEHSTGVWLSGLDILAQDALSVRARPPGNPQMVVYLARGAGAAIRRAKTRLPGGQPNPVGIIRLPRERMIGSGIASSLIHEVGHQGAALFNLVPSLKAELDQRAAREPGRYWDIWSLWISEIVADLWSVGKAGITSTVGLLAVVSLPRYFVFRPTGTDPHPMPYLRVLISAAIGNALYPHPQWGRLASIWRTMYPMTDLPKQHRAWITRCEARIKDLVGVLMRHRSPAIGGRELRTFWPTSERQPHQLLELHATWRQDLAVMARQPPSLVFAVVGQAKAAGLISPRTESRQLSSVLTAWAVRRSLTPPTASPPQALRASQSSLPLKPQGVRHAH